MPIILGALVSFSGVLVPYAAIQPFWHYWLYYVNVSLSLSPASSVSSDQSPHRSKPFTYLIGALSGERAETGGTGDVELQQCLARMSNQTSGHVPVQVIIKSRIRCCGPLGKQRQQGSLRYAAKYDDSWYYVEWKRYGWVSTEQARKKVQDSIQSLANLLNAAKDGSFRTLDCFGVLHEEVKEQFMFLYRWPEDNFNNGAEFPIAPKSLSDCMWSSYKPSLSARLDLAKKLARSVLLLHAADWMHKAISSHNILFFPRDGSGSGRRRKEHSLEEPFLVGFDYSRPSGLDQPSQPVDRNDFYRHPDCLRRYTFKRRYDIYSLGLVLMVIAKWRPLSLLFTELAREKYLEETKKDPRQMTKDDWKSVDAKALDEILSSDLEYMRERLLDRARTGCHPDDVAFRAGSAYWDVTETCIGTAFDPYGDQEQDDVTLQRGFFLKVVRPLEKLRV
jgi:serine/threonine protein kinase